MEIILTAVEEELYEAWSDACSGLKDVEVFRGDILSLRVEAVVSPANSFGFMDGGIDTLYVRRFGKGIQSRLQKMIQHEPHHGELLVGGAILLPTGDESIPILISAPTMRVPMRLPEDTINPYLAARAALRVALRHQVGRIAFPGLGTGVGRVPPEACARQVRKAIEDVVCGMSRFPKTWIEAHDEHQRLYGDEIRNLQV